MIMNWEHADVDLGRAETCALAGDDQITGERESERPREHVTVGGTDRRLAELAQRPEHRHEPFDSEVLVHERHLGREPGEVAATREHFLVRRSEHDAPDGVIVARGHQRRQHVAEQRVGERIASLRLVEGDRRDTRVRDLVEDRLVWHRPRSLLPARSRAPSAAPRRARHTK
jgi:hypothetical protein